MTKQLRQIAVGNELASLQSAAPGLSAGAAAGGKPPPPPPKKEKKTPPIPKQLSTKISSSSSKLTECMAWETKISDNTALWLDWIWICFFWGLPLRHKNLNKYFLVSKGNKSKFWCLSRSANLLNGFKSELAGRKDAIVNAKMALENCYAKTLGKQEKDILADADLMMEVNTQIATIESAFTSFNGTVKSIRTAIDSGLEDFFHIFFLHVNLLKLKVRIHKSKWFFYWIWGVIGANQGPTEA